MANLKELKSRISSVKSTQKITKAMKLVSAAKLRRAKQRAEDTFHYADRLQKILKRLSANLTSCDAPKLLVGSKSDDKQLFIIVSSDRGLCGGFNTTLVKEVKQKARQLTMAGKKVSFVIIGKKAKELLAHETDYEIVNYIEGLSKKKSLVFADANEIGKQVNKLFEDGKFDVCTLFYNKFVSTIEKEITAKQLVPLSEDSNDNQEEQISSTGALFEYEPDENEILEDLLPKNISVQIFNALLENSASEHGARMTAMDNATRNAGDMIKSLTLQYNRTRQAVITSELIEIISGAEAL